MEFFRGLSLTRLGWVIAILTLVLDQGSKNLLLYGFDFITRTPAEYIKVTPFFNLVMIWNKGVSFGMFQADSLLGTFVLVGFSLVMVVALSIWLMSARNRWLACGLGMVIGGAIGNVIDRLLYGAVADFFDFHLMGMHWYIFNIADVGIVVGVGILLLESFLPGRSAHEEGEPASADTASDR